MSTYSTYKPENVKLHVVAGKAFGLGAALAASIFGIASSSSWHSSLSRVAIYSLCQCLFHTLEFFITAIYNTQSTDDDSFILNDRHLHYTYLVSVAESVVKQHFLSYNNNYLWLGFTTILIGQYFRSLAMYTAGVSFNHHIQQQHAAQHKLVTNGVYKILRHPSYFGYFWWFIGTQILLQNWVMLALGAVKLTLFFRIRIDYEENLLMSFFGEQYAKYKARTPVGIPFVK